VKPENVDSRFLPTRRSPGGDLTLFRDSSMMDINGR
jgi:hypothetical protein